MDANYIVASSGVALLLVLIILALVGSCYYRRYKKSSTTESQQSPVQFIAPRQAPPFVIPPYLIKEEPEEEVCKENALEENPANQAAITPPVRSFSVPSRAYNVVSYEATNVDERSAKEPTLYRPQYRRSVSSFVGHSAGRVKKISIAPSGKLQVTLSFVTTTNLLVIQVNGTFDMPQVRMCGVSTPYLRVQLVPGDQLAKETRSNFMNLSCNRLCVFDRLTLEEAKQSSLNFVVLDYDRFSRSDFVAEVMFPLADVDLEEGATLSRHLVSRTLEKGEDRGALVVSLCQQPLAGQLAVIILKAERLPHPKPDSATAIDTYVKVAYYVQGKNVDRKKTKVVKKTTSPAFNERFLFEMKEEDLRNSHIVCEVYCGDSARRMERIGHINLGLESFGSEIRHWNEMMTSPQKQVAETHQLRV